MQKSITELVEKRIVSADSLENSIEILELMLSANIAVWTDGTIYNIKQLIAKVNGLKIEIYSKEHSPPHFHITGNNVDAVFSLADGTFLDGKIAGRDRDLIEFWYKRSRSLLVETWNSSRPTNCPVGPIE